MNKGSNSRRSRGRGKGHGQGRPQKSHNFDSNGPEQRVRGNAQQVYEKYLALARDAMAAGDRIATENYFQHAEHYLRVIMASDNGQGRLEAIRRRAQFGGPFGPDEFSEEGMEGDEDGGQPQPQAQQQRPQQGNGENHRGDNREARSEGGNGSNRKVQIEKSDKQQDDDQDDDEGLRRTLAI